MPSELGGGDAVVQNKYRVTLVPLAIECAYTTEQAPTEADYVRVNRDLGSGFLVVPVAVVVAAGMWVAVGRAATHPTARSRE